MFTWSLQPAVINYSQSLRDVIHSGPMTRTQLPIGQWEALSCLVLPLRHKRLFTRAKGRFFRRFRAHLTHNLCRVKSELGPTYDVLRTEHGPPAQLFLMASQRFMLMCASPTRPAVYVSRVCVCVCVCACVYKNGLPGGFSAGLMTSLLQKTIHRLSILNHLAIVLFKAAAQLAAFSTSEPQDRWHVCHVCHVWHVCHVQLEALRGNGSNIFRLLPASTTH